MIGIHRVGALLVAAAALAACTPNESGNIPCKDTSNCPAAYAACSSRGFCVEAAPLDHLEMIAGDAQTAASGSQLTQALTVRALDKNGNAVPNVAISWTASASATLSATSTKTGADGKSQVTATLGKQNGAYTYGAAAAGVSSAPVTFHATGVSGPAAKISGASGADQTGVVGTTLGTALSARVTDINDNPVAGVTVTWATSGAGSVAQPSAVTGADGLASTNATLGTLVATNVYTASATDGTTPLAGSPVTFNETGIADVANSIIVAGFPNPANAGTQGFVLLTVKDQYGNTAIGYRGTVHLTTDNIGTTLPTLPSDYTFTAGDLGSKTLPVTLNTASSSATFFIAATDTVTSTITGSQVGIVVNPAPAHHFLVVASPSTRVAGVALTSLVVTAKDIFGNTVTNYAGTVGFTSTDPQASLPPDSTLVNGTRSFSAVVLRTVGAQTIAAKDTVTATVTGTSNAVTVTPAPANTLLVVPDATSQTAGVQFNLTITAKDAFGNVATNYAGTLHFTSNDGQAVLPPNSGLTNGTGVFPVTLKTAGAATVTATDTVNGALFQTANLTVTPAGTSKFLVQAGSPQTAGQPFSVTVTAQDAFNNTTPGYAGVVIISSSDGAATLPPQSVLTLGVGAFTVTLNTPGTSTVTATDSVTATVAGTSTAITVNGASHLVLKGASPTVAFPTGVVQGVPNTITVIAEDVNNVVTPAYRGKVQFATNNAGATLPADYTFTQADAGIHTFVGGVTLSTLAAGTALITATDAVNPITGQLSGITVAGPPVRFQIAAARIVGGSRDGQIFITGGSTTNDNSGIASTRTYFYDPALSTLVVGPSLNTPRYAHTATATVNGQVVIAGGDFSGSNADGEFELCSTDGATPACVSVNGSSARRNAARCNAAAALVTTTPSVRVILAGGDNCANTTAFTSWDIWDSANPTITSTSGAGQALATGRRLFTATALGSGKVLFAGGASTATADLFTNASTLSSATMAATSGGMSTTRLGHTATVLKAGVTTACPTAGATCVLIAGGTATPGKTWEIYDSATNSFPRGPASSANDLLAPGRNQHAAAAFANGKVLLAGGNDGAGTSLKSTESFDPAAATLGFTAGGDFGTGLTRNHPGFAYAPAQDILMVAGGNASTPAVEQLVAP